MVKKLHIFFYLFLFPFLINGQLNKVVEDWKNDKELKNASISFCVVDINTSNIILEQNSHQSLIPASTLKVVTTSAALGILGENFRYETKIYYTGNLDKKSGILDGDIIIFGGGDPTLQSEYFSKDSLLITDKWASIIKNKGIKEIKGSIIGDASNFERTIPDDWIWSDINNYFGATPCGLSFMDNKFKILFTSNNSGEPAFIQNTFPVYLSKPYNITSNVISKGTEDEAFVYGDPFSFTKIVSGNIPPNKKNYEIEASLPDPALLCAEKLFLSLKKIGVICNENSIKSNFQKNKKIDSWQLLYSHISLPLNKIIYYTNQFSNNLFCESLLLTLGNGNIINGITAVKTYWQKRGLDINELFMADGSGLSRANTITTSFQAKLLSKISRDTVNGKFIMNSLPLAGKSGSMINIGRGKYIENNMCAKTGYIKRVRGFCGFVKSRSGKNIAFSVLFNNFNCSPLSAKLKIEKFLIELGEL